MFKRLLSTYRGIVFFVLLSIGISLLCIYRYTTNGEYNFTYPILAVNWQMPDTPEIKDEIPKHEAEIPESEAEVIKPDAPSAKDASETPKAELLKPFEKNSNGNGEMDKQHLEKIKQRFAQRKKILQGNCTQTLPGQLRIQNNEASYYVKQYRTYFCVSAKGGATTWKTHLLRMKGLPGNNVHKGYNEKRIRAGPAKVADRIAGKVTSVISVRHPLARLVSAYGDKFGDGSGRGATPRFMLMVRQYFKSWGKPVTFRQFLSFVIHQGKGGPGRINNHWRPISWNCKPCTGNYDYVVKLETLDSDLAYLVNLLGIKEINIKLKHNAKKSKAKINGYESYFKSLPPDMLKDIYTIYKYDFILFDYAVPQFMLDAISS
nr:carbohydrate sulfotransferase 11-like isoform X1 [Penaeus vannamei]